MEHNASINRWRWIYRSLALALVVPLCEQSLAFATGDVASWGSFLNRFLGSFPLTLVLALLSYKLPWSLIERCAAITAALFAVAQINIGLELLFFSSFPPRQIFLDWGVGFLKSLILALVVSLLFPPPRQAATIWVDFLGLFSSRRLSAWLVRLPLAELSYVVTYFVFGAIAFHYTRPYYTEPSYGLNLKLPDPGVVLKLQFLRSFIYLATALPLISGLRLRKLQKGILIGLLLFVAGGLAPLVSYPHWPALLRYYHTLEILSQNFTSGFLFVLLLDRPADRKDRSVRDHSNVRQASTA
jgi:hypothetical protein